MLGIKTKSKWPLLVMCAGSVLTDLPEAEDRTVVALPPREGMATPAQQAFVGNARPLPRVSGPVAALGSLGKGREQ